MPVSRDFFLQFPDKSTKMEYIIRGERGICNENKNKIRTQSHRKNACGEPSLCFV